MKYGQGELQYENGDKYIGNFEEDKKHGKGKYVKKNGKILEGIWSKGKIIEKLY